MSLVHKNQSHFHQNHDENENKRYSDQTNESQFMRHSDSTIEELENDEQNQNSTKMSFINQLFSRQTSFKQNITNQNKKAINWLITFCWTENYSLQTLWNSIGYYYAYINTATVTKGKLTILLLVLVNLSLKLFEPEKILKNDEMIRKLGTQVTKEIFNQTQSEVLQLFEFDLLFDNNLSLVYDLSGQEQERQKILFLSEIIFLQKFEPAIMKKYLRQVFELAYDPRVENDAKMEINKISKDQKYIKSIKLKYYSRFNVDQYWLMIIQ